MFSNYAQHPLITANYVKNAIYENAKAEPDTQLIMYATVPNFYITCEFISHMKAIQEF